MSFSELNLPRQEIHGINAGNWFVSEKGTNMCLVNDTSPYALLPAAFSEHENSKFYFDTIVDAFSCSAGYYMAFGMTYPYVDEWMVERLARDAGINTPTSNSQVMEFI